MNAKERSTAWAVDQLDPDNWLRIPDFGINPKDVAFEGFAIPIVAPNFKSHGLQCLLREHVKTARALIRKEKRSLDEVKADFLQVLDMMDAKPAFEKIDASRRQAMATFYMVSMQSAELADRHSTDRNSTSLELCYEAITQCAEGVRNSALLSLKGKKESFDAAINEAIAGYVDSHRRTLSAAGLQGAKSRNKPFEAVKSWAIQKAVGMRGAHRDISRMLVPQLPEHLANVSKDPERLIYDAIRENKKPNSYTGGQPHVTAGQLGVTAGQPHAKKGTR